MKSLAKNSWRLNQSNKLIAATALSLFGLVSYYYASAQILSRYSLGDILLVIAAIVAGLPIARNALSSLRYKIIGIDLLVTIAVVGAIIIGEYWEAAAVAILFTFGHYLEARALHKTRSALESLVEEMPDTATVERDGELLEVSPEDVKLQEVVVVKSGQKIPVDGQVVGGNASVDQSAMTGESMPVEASADTYVYSGSLVTAGYLRIAAQKVGDSTLFASIIEMVEEAQDKKAKTQVFLEKFSAYYTPAIMVLAAITYLVTRDIYLSLTLLVIACPGALVVAAPVSMVAGIGNAAKRGILVKGGEAIENTKSVKVIAFDKTGTLTEGQPRVSAVKTFGISEIELLELAASAEYYSEHPLGVAVLAYAKETLATPIKPPTSTEILTGLGVMAETSGGKVLVGNQKLMADSGVQIDRRVRARLDQQQAKGQTTLLIAKDGALAGIISMSDHLRPGTRQLIEGLLASGKHVVMLTGDNQTTAQSMAYEAGIKEFYGQLLPADKLEYIAKLRDKYGTVMMVGDGVNDAPALATADVGVAIEGAGKDVAIDTADVVLLSGGITKLAYLLPLSQAVVRNMKTNIYFAVGLVVVLLVGVLTDNVIMSLGMLIHIASVILVTMNASRLIRYKEKSRA